MKFNLDTAWKDTTGLLTRNLGLLAVIAGVFFFLPYALLTVVLPQMETLEQAQATGDVDAMMAAVRALYADYWWVFLVMGIVQGIGLLAMLALLRRRANPTVAEALSAGTRAVPSYIGVQIVQALAIGVIAVVLVGAFSLGGAALGTLGALLALVICSYVLVKFSLAAPVVAIDGELNPLRALSRSWALTKGNSLRLFLFFLLLIVAFTVVSALVSMVVSLVFALGGEQAALLGGAVVSGLVNAGLVTLMVCVMAAAHAQLTRLSAPATPSVPRTHQD